MTTRYERLHICKKCGKSKPRRFMNLCRECYKEEMKTIKDARKTQISNS